MKVVTRTNSNVEDDMRTITSAVLALSILTGFAAQAMAYDPDTSDAKRFFEQRDRESR
jgi:hypothetical protein